ncbi:MAG: hypothetical protein JWL90_1212 [Chthoniobacteraceae bacterium]|nr:hypothetical protein [Chthoniobacteraceae bacterium]
MNVILAIIRKDLKIFFNNPKAVIITILVPIAIGTFMGSVTGGVNGRTQPNRVPVCVAMADEGATAAAILVSFEKDPNLRMELVDEAAARDRVLRGKVGVAVIIPKGFGKDATRAMFGPGKKPQVTILNDPSKAMELSIVKGALTQNIMQIVSRDAFGGAGGQNFIEESLSNLSNQTDSANTELFAMLKSVQKFMDRPRAPGSDKASGNGLAGGMSVPYETITENMTQKRGAAYNGYAHSFGGMAVQFVLMFSIETGVALLLERQRGLWKRLQSAPLSRAVLLGGRAASTTIISLLTLAACWAFCIVALGVRVEGSWIGFLICNLIFALFASSVGLLLAAIGRSPEATRGIAIFAVLMLVMLGGAWVPSFLFPSWLQQATLFVPTRWIVDAFDAMTWRGLGFSAIVMPSLVLLGYTAVFGALSVLRFKWEEA